MNKGYHYHDDIHLHEGYPMNGKPLLLHLPPGAQNLPRTANHQLATVARYLGIPLDRHHHALADAEACARIALRVFADHPR